MIDYLTDMKNSLISAVVALVCAGTMAAFFPLSSEAKGRRPEDVVRPGIEVLESRGFDQRILRQVFLYIPCMGPRANRHRRCSRA